MTFAKASKKITKESEERPFDNISKRGKERMLNRLKDEQEVFRKPVNNMYNDGGPLEFFKKYMDTPDFSGESNPLINKIPRYSTMWKGEDSADFTSEYAFNVPKLNLDVTQTPEITSSNLDQYDFMRGRDRLPIVDTENVNINTPIFPDTSIQSRSTAVVPNVSKTSNID